MSQLGQRVASALVLAAIVAAAIVWLPTAGFAAFLHLLALVAAYEWARLAGVETRPAWLSYAALLSVLAVVLWLMPLERHIALSAAVAFWLVLASGLVVLYPATADLVRPQVFLLPAGVIAIIGAWTALVMLHGGHGPGFVIWLLVAVAFADTGAYFAGRRFGRRKLAPKVSPNKTWEGLAGGGVAVCVCAAVGAQVLPGTLLAWLGAGFVVLLFAVIGDLFESVLKRLRGVKDSGNLLPGHGGALDRIDGVLAAAPIFAIYAHVVLPAK